jgi:copper oxidase (laccase) domain-containing protein
MIKCDNCEKDAVYTCADPGVNPINYCADCLPVWLQQRASAGHFPLVESIVEESTTTSKKKKVASSDENNQ